MNKIVNTAVFISMVAINALAVLLPINGQSTGQIADLYPSLFTPAGFTFGIWSLIYLWLLIFIVAQWFYAHKVYFVRLSMYFQFSCIANMAWIVAWHYLLPWVALIIMLTLLASLIKIFLLFSNLQISAGERWSLQFPFHVYLGWISVATIANASAALVSIPWYGTPLSQAGWTILMLLIAALLSAYMAIRYQAIAYSSVTVWALYGILSRWQTDPASSIDDAALYLMAFLAVIIATVAFKLIKKNSGQRI